MRHNLSSFFSPVAWIPGNFAGYPMFLNYFPLPFYLAALLSLLIPLQIAFKLVTLLAIIPLPAAVYFSLRQMGCNGNIPALGSVFAIPFLFMTENSMWGGNITSTLSGEFCYGISFVLFVVFVGKLYRDAPKRKSLISNSIMEALIALGSGYPLLQAGAGTSYFFLRGGCARYIVSLHALAFGLAGFWLLPLLWRLPWDTPFAHAWYFRKWSEIFPPVLLPSLAGALIGLGVRLRNMPVKLRDIRAFLKADSACCPEYYLWWQFGIALVGFSLAHSLGLADIRFLPFAQIIIAMLGAIGWGNLISRYRYPRLCTVLFTLAILALSLTGASRVDSWIRWNYSGMGGSKPLAKSFSLVNDFLRGTENSPRVVYEYSQIHDGAGTPRAFELLPFLSGRSTLEGLYMQSGVSSPFVYYVQSELTQSPSSLFESDFCSRPDVTRAVKHLDLFNVSQVIAVSEDVSNALDQSPAYELQIAFPPYKVYRLVNAASTYVSPLHFKPFRIPYNNWKAAQFDWLRKSSTRVPLIVAPPGTPGDYWKDLPALDAPVENIPQIPILRPNEAEPVAGAVLDSNRITITTNKPGHPLWIKVSYHPDWRITSGEGELYLASPSFMLLVPKTARVTIEFDTRHGVYLLGKILSLLTLAVCLLIFLAAKYPSKTPNSFLHADSKPARPSSPPALFPPNARIMVASAAMAALVLAAVFTRNHRDPILLYHLASNEFTQAEDIEMQIKTGLAPPNIAERKERLMLRAAALADECITKYPDSSVYDSCIFFKAKVLSDQKKWLETRMLVENFLKSHPDSRVVPDTRLLLAEACLNLGEEDKARELMWSSLLSWPAGNAGMRAGLRLAEILGPGAVLAKGKAAFDSGRYLQAYAVFKSLTLHSNEEIKSESTLFLAYCCYRLNRWEDASVLFLQWLNGHFESPESGDVQFALRQCQTLSSLNKAWQTPSETPQPQSLYQYLKAYVSRL